MKRQRGFALPTWALYALAAAAALGALWWAYDTVDGRAYARGKSEVEAEYVKRDNKALQDALNRVAELQAEVSAREDEHRAELEKIKEDYRKEQADADRQRDADIAAAVAGTLRLRDPGAAAGAANCDRGPEAAAGPAAGGGDAAASGELSGQASRFLLSLMHEADDIVRQLGLAQQVIREQIRACNGQ